MKKMLSITLAAGIMIAGVQITDAGRHEEALCGAAETDCLEDAMEAIEKGVCNENEALKLAEYCESNQVTSYLREIAAENEALEEDELVEETGRKSPRIEREARRKGTFLG